MHENEFEKQVQKKMEELEFVPSDAVWQNVDKEINKKEKRRRPIFWVFFFFGLMLLGGGYFYITKNKISTITSENQKERIASGQKSENEKLKKNQDERASDVAKNLVNEKNNESKKIDDNTNDESRKNLTENNFGAKKIIRNDKSYDKSSLLIEKNSEQKLVDDNKNIVQENNNKADKKDLPATKGEAENDEQNSTGKTFNKINKPDSAENKKSISLTNNKAEKDSEKNNSLPKNKKEQKKSSKWEIGYTASAGISGIDKSLFKNFTPAQYYSYSFVNTANPSYQLHSASEIRDGFSVDVGVLLRKNFSKTISVSIGVNYHYYSTRMNVGKYIDSSRIVYVPGSSNLSGFNPNVPGSLPLTNAQSYYGDSSFSGYINHYHIIELPVLFGLQLNKSQKLPIFWEAGINASYLFSSNALQFDPNSEIYYKSYKVMNKMQLHGSTSFMVGVHIDKTLIQFGPQFQYQFSNLLNKNVNSPEHLFYGGIRLVLVPQKNNY